MFFNLAAKFRLKIAFGSLSISLLVEFDPGPSTARQRMVSARATGRTGMFFHHRARLLVGSAALVSSTLLHSNSGLAETDTGTMQVTASVVQTCSLGTITVLDFDIYTPGTNSDAEAIFEVQCTQGGDVQVDFNDGLNSTGANVRHMRKNGSTQVIRYQLFTTSNRNTPWSEPQVKTVSSGTNEFPVYGTILGQLSQDVPEGDYSDSVTVTLTF